jgi:hypothetical protein
MLSGAAIFIHSGENSNIGKFLQESSNHWNNNDFRVCRKSSHATGSNLNGTSLMIFCTSLLIMTFRSDIAFSSKAGAMLVLL